ncbi:Eco57I restriction-modification methylase [Geodermatophilus pulveris]|uniref:site-specific DNA-methyltransferase (adenine-specific) n=1 Tax=Geodermatophilus pulveris TaxID=1564159 RepID=A0A239HFU4_9ACTN|nr:DNA methyltransferase [Geodermatophilus pulveris]SNS79134.1 Eco57I restriction-modification methylase [Geodermatophilus pulveris]
MGFIRLDKEAARQELARLVEQYATQRASLEAAGSTYPEAQVRLDYIDKMLRILGWDVDNDEGLPHALRDVVVEQTLSEEGSTGRPDYRLRVDGRDRLPWEAKKPSVRLPLSRESAHQTRTYGFTLRLPAAVLTNFSELVVFDTLNEPDESQGTDFAVIPGCRFAYTDYVPHFDDLWQRLSYESVAGDDFYSVYEYSEPPRGASPFDRSFLEHFRGWRRQLAQGIADRDRALPAAQVGRLTQRLLNALLFLRVCEDRNIKRYEDLLRSSAAHALPEQFKRADEVFNAGLFRALDAVEVDADVLGSVVRDLYWPNSKFAFGLLEPDTLAALYEQFLAERIEIDADRVVTLVPKPELVHAGGVVPTPAAVVDRLFDLAVGPHLVAGEPVPAEFTLADPACGSGVFLVAALQRLICHTEAATGPLDLAGRGRLARTHVFGVDIDGEAVEVASLSLLLVVLGEDLVDITSAHAVLPSLNHNLQVGNAVVGPDFDRIVPDAAAVPEVRAAVAPFDWARAFPDVHGAGGFTCIVGNPPYIRIQVLASYMPDQLEYFQDPRSGCASAQSHNFDLYMIFIERSLRLLAPDGTLAFVVKHGFTSSAAGSRLRGVLGKRLRQLVHFGVQQLFPGRLTYTCLIVACGTDEPSNLEVSLVSDAPGYLSGDPQAVTQVSIPRSELGEAVWPIAASESASAFAAMETAAIARLGDENWVDIFVGVQTSADDVFMLRVAADDPASECVDVLDEDGVRWPIERGVLRPAIRDVPLAPYGDQPDGDYVAIFPYEVAQPRPGHKRGRATPFDPQTMAATFPKALAYLRAKEGRLRARAVTLDEAFWAYGRTQSLWRMDGLKIINRTLSVVPQYVPDRLNHVVPGGGSGPYTLLRPSPRCPISVEVVIALLSHPAVDAYVAARARAFQGGFVVHSKESLRHVPIPPLPVGAVAELERNTTELQTLEHRLREENDSVLRASIIQRRGYLASENRSIITKAYGLTEDQVQAAL